MRQYPKKNFRGRKNTTKNKRKSNIDYRKLAQSATPEVKQKEFVAEISFNDMELDSKLKANVLAKGFTHPTEIQEATYQHVKNGDNVVGIANTGTGKTAAFLIPIIQKICEQGHSQDSLIIVPTRELANQVELEFRSLSKGLNLKSVCFIGGGSVSKDVSLAKRSNDLIIGTPGRLLDLINRKALRLSNVKTLVLDEFDRMLDMGFINDINRILDQIKSREQTLLYSATLDKTQAQLVSTIAKDHKKIQIDSGKSANGNIDQHVIKVEDGEDKYKMFQELLGQPEFTKVIVFAETKRLVDRLAKKLNNNGIKTGLIHGDKSQNFRNKAIAQFKKGNSKVLIATDVVARGIDIDDISHVVNYQLPQTMDSYLHRIGRTGRAGKKGVAYTLVD